MINARAKGSRAEREICDALRERGFHAERSEQRYVGGLSNPDVITDARLAGKAIHPEVKAEEKLSIGAAMRQAIDDCDSCTPVVIHRQNYGEWLVTMRFDDFVELLEHEEYSEKQP